MQNLFFNPRSLGVSTIVVGLLLISTACSTADVIKAIDIAVEAAEVAIPVLGETGIISPILATYVNQAGTGLEDVTAVLASSETAAQKAQDVRADLVAVVLPDISTLTPAQQAKFTDINAALQGILKLLPATSASTALLSRAERKGKTKPSIHQLGQLAMLNIRARLVAAKTFNKAGKYPNIFADASLKR